jgi:hypothetical protein
MASKNKEQTESKKENPIVVKTKAINTWGLPKLLAAFWLVETVARAYVSYLLLTSSHEYIIVLTGIYFAVTAGMLVVKHFFSAHR